MGFLALFSVFGRFWPFLTPEMGFEARSKYFWVLLGATWKEKALRREKRAQEGPNRPRGPVDLGEKSEKLDF